MSKGRDYSQLLLRVSFLAGTVAAMAAFAEAAPGAFGTKGEVSAGPVQATAPGMGAMPFIQMLVALGIVFCIIKFLLPKGMKLLGNKLVPNNSGSIIIEDGAAFAGGHLYIVTARDKTLLLSASQAGVACLADLSNTKGNSAETPVFMDFLEEEARSPRHSYVDPSGEPTAYMKSSLSEDEIRSAIKRLEQLGK